MMNPNWNRWIFASVSNFFDSLKGSLDMYVEGTDKAGRRQEKDYIEFRLNGPYSTEISRDEWKLVFDVNILVCSIKDTKDIHRIYRNAGIVTSMFRGEIPIYKMGDGPEDNAAVLLGCAVLETEGRGGGIYVDHYGQIDPVLPVLQATVEAGYKMYLETQ